MHSFSVLHILDTTRGHQPLEQQRMWPGECGNPPTIRPVPLGPAQDLRTRNVDVISRILEEEAGNTDAEWLLWVRACSHQQNMLFREPPGCSATHQ